MDFGPTEDQATIRKAVAAWPASPRRVPAGVRSPESEKTLLLPRITRFEDVGKKTGGLKLFIDDLRIPGRSAV